ncbi:hypothetical protein HNY73_010240 [Argiope bruennichi]|uniref:Uncharacterized protein n=1 Tax=Argiope bruennichi TaxID=94029 RepID=A0A8T0F2N2_ARGBR|nr:hypothetical protein HNY73_010240 [Argiope bruennichi]
MSLTALNRQRGTFKTKINMIGTFIKEFEPSDDSKKDIIQLNTKLTSVNDILQGLDQMNCELCALPNDVDLKDAFAVTLELENFALEMKLIITSPISPHSLNRVAIHWKRRWVAILATLALKFGAKLGDHMEEVLEFDEIKSDDGFFFPQNGVRRSANVVLQDVYYLDGILTGCSSLHELELLKTELILLFKSAGMSFHKWSFAHANSESPDINFDQLSDETVKTLGVL